MSTTTIMRWAREQRAGDVVAKAVLFVIAAHADRHGICSPGPALRTLAAEADTSEASVRRGLAVLSDAQLVEVRPGRGRGSNGYRLLLDTVRSVRHPGDAQRTPRSATRSDAQQDLFGASPERRTTTPASASPDDRSASDDHRSASGRASDQQRCGIEELQEELQEGTAPPPPAGAGASAPTHAREAAPRHRSRAAEHVPPAELSKQAYGGRAFALVTAWAQHNPGVTTAVRRKLGAAVDQLLRQGADETLVPAALDAAHDPRWRNPVAALPHAYDDVRRSSRPPPNGSPYAAANGRTSTTTQRVQGALAHLDPEDP